MKKIEVVAAIIRHEKRILCVQRGYSKLSYICEKYEFAGGKIEHGESPESALSRELLEELAVNVQNIQFFMTVEHQYPDFHITMHSFFCTIDRPEDIVLHEHIDQKWLLPQELASLDWAAADIPIVNKLANLKIGDIM